jgi:hypothetical protein
VPADPRIGTDSLTDVLDVRAESSARLASSFMNEIRVASMAFAAYS